MSRFKKLGRGFGLGVGFLLMFAGCNSGETTKQLTSEPGLLSATATLMHVIPSGIEVHEDGTATLTIPEANNVETADVKVSEDTSGVETVTQTPDDADQETNTTVLESAIDENAGGVAVLSVIDPKTGKIDDIELEILTTERKAGKLSATVSFSKKVDGKAAFSLGDLVGIGKKVTDGAATVLSILEILDE